MFLFIGIFLDFVKWSGLLATKTTKFATQLVESCNIFFPSFATFNFLFKMKLIINKPVSPSY